MYVYVITNSVNGKVYVGKSVMPATRWARHKYDSRTIDSPLYRAMRKYGVDAFEFAVVEQCESESASFVAEQQWVAKLGSIVPSGYNQNAGGEGAPRPTPDGREKCGRGRRGKRQSPEHVEARAATHRGKKRSPKAVANMRSIWSEKKAEQSAKIRDAHAQGMSMRQIAGIVGCCKRTVCSRLKEMGLKTHGPTAVNRARLRLVKAGA